MDDNSVVTWEAFSWKRLTAAEGILAGVLGFAAAIAAGIGWGHAGSWGVLAAGAALLVCWLPNALSLFIMAIFRDPQHSVATILLSMMLRMGVPLGLAVVLHDSGHWLVDAGVLPMVLAMYLIGLGIETVLSLWIVGAFRTPAVKAS
jgi:hypothetical protein